MKNIIKIIFAIICGTSGTFLLYETIKSLKFLDSWGLGFVFYTLPLTILAILLIVETIILIKQIIKAKEKDEITK